MADEVAVFLVKLYWVNKQFQTTKTIFFTEEDPVKVEFEVLTVINLSLRFAVRSYSVHRITPSTGMPYLTRRDMLALRDLLKAQLAIEMAPYPVKNFGVTIIDTQVKE